MNELDKDLDLKLDALKDCIIWVYEEILPKCINSLDAHNHIAQYVMDIISAYEKTGKYENVIDFDKYLERRQLEQGDPKSIS